MNAQIRKRSGELAPFDETKIRSAVFKANIRFTQERLSPHQLDELTHQVVRRALAGNFIPTVEQVQDLVEECLIDHGYAQTAKAYILYRDEHRKAREFDPELMKTYENLTFRPNREEQEYRGINEDTAMGTMLEYGSEGAKAFYDRNVIPPEISQAHREGAIHIHDKDFYALTETSCQIDPITLFHGGFSTGHGYLREPNDIRSYTALACIAIQANQNEMHESQGIPNFDYAMAPGIDKTYRKAYFSSLRQYWQILLGFSHDDAMALAEEVKEQLGTDLALTRTDAFGEALIQWLPRHQVEKGFQPISSEEAKASHQYAVRQAEEETDAACWQAMEALIHNLNTMNSRAGAQVPYSSLNYGTDTSPQGRMVIRNLLKATEAGLGDGGMPIFPVHIFKVKEGVNLNPSDPNYDLFRQAIHVACKRVSLHFSFLDAPFNLRWYRPGDYTSEAAYQGNNIRVMENVADPDCVTPCGRGNLSFTSINLPRIGIEAQKDIKRFYQILDERIDLCIEQLLHRFKIQCSKKAYNYPFLMGQGVWIDSEKLDRNDSVAEVLKHGTLSVGFIGLAETLVALTGKHHGESEESYQLGYEIISYMRKRMDDKSQETGLNFTLLATPAEGLSGRFVRIDQKKFGKIPGVTDREYYTNSFHIPVYYPISAFEKIKKEAPFHALTNAGHISYVELDGDVCKNIDAFESVIRCMKEAGIGYGSVNHPVDRDPVCGYNGIIDDVCPRCGRHAGEGVPLEKLQELRKKYHDVPDYSCLIR